MEITKNLLNDIPIRRHLTCNDPFFEDGNSVFCFHEKTVNSDIDFLVDSITAVHIEEFSCSVKGCMETFTNPIQYNRHFDMLHKFRCVTCFRNFSSNYLLSLHISESHDAFFQAQRDKRLAIYQCLVESCGRTFKVIETRRRHLVEKHKYPADFRFHAVKRTHQKYQKNKGKKKQTVNNNKARVKEVVSNIDMVVDDIAEDEGQTKQNVGKRENNKKQKLKTKTGQEIRNIEDENSVGSENLMDVSGGSDIPKKPESDGYDTEMSGDNVIRHSSQKPNYTINNKRRTPTSICFGRGIQKGFSKLR